MKKTDINRREFMKIAGAAAGLAAMAPMMGAGAEDTLKGKVKTAVGYDMIRVDGSPMDKLNLVKGLGIAGVELSVGSKVDHDELRKASDATGVSVHGIVHGWSLDKIPASIDLAKKVGATTVLVAPPQVKEDYAYDECYAKSQAAYREVLPYAEKQQVYLLVETVWNNFLLSPMEMARYIDEMNSPWFQGYFDIGNMVKYGWSEQWIRILGKRVKKVHLKDYSRKIAETQGPWKGFDCEIGEGSNDWTAIRKALLDTGFEGWATAEVGGGDKARLTQLAGEMNKVMALD
jgi:hexulose-6-phosphate isomerase